ncbi:GNAT family N-acetyltransferase [Sphingomonas sp.]|uniref:GNAT family N-acetyltransferase n=1 Tax=Sphingomonas sp. TaxID=28214 RepID=UPI00286A1403|nr:GNAT family N-acetyltransferase [Sphingomonas sp.]
MNQSISYRLEPDLDAASFVEVLIASGLATRRPVADSDRIEQMLRGASIIVTARSESKLVGVARALTDHAFCCYLSDLAVDARWVGQGIGRELIRRAHSEAGQPIVDLILLAAPEAETYYPHIGLTQFPHCFIIKRAN